MILKWLILSSSAAFAQTGPQYTSEIKQAPSTVEERVNEHMIKTNRKIEIETKKKAVELQKTAPQNLQYQPTPKKQTPFIVSPKKQEQDPNLYRDQYDHNVGKDPSTEFEQGIIQERTEPTQEEVNAEYIREFKENAARAGVQVEIDPKTLKARPVNSTNGHK